MTNEERDRKRLETWEMLYTALATMQWIGDSNTDTAHCPDCDGEEENGHISDCLIGAALRAGKEAR